MTRKRLIKAFFWLFALLLFISVVSSVPLSDTLDALRRLTWQQVILLIALNGLILGLLNARWWTILRGYGYKLPFFALLGYRLATFGVSYFTPGPHFGGEPLQVYLVEKEQRAPRATAIAAMSLDKTLELLVNFLFLLTGVILIVQQRLLSSTMAVGILVLLSFLLLLPGLYLVAISNGRTPLSHVTERLGQAKIWQRKPALQERMQRAVAVVQASEDEIRRFLQQAPLSLIAAFAISLVAWLLMIVEFWLMALFLGAPLAPLQLVTALVGARIAILLFLPAGLGVLEASQALAFGTVGLNPALGISLSLLIRARDVLLGSAGLWWGSRKLGATLAANETRERQSP